MIEHIYAPFNGLSLMYYGHFANTKFQQILRTWVGHDGFEANEVLPDLFIGNIDSTYDTDMLEKLGITHIIVSIAGYTPPFPDKFQYLVVHALDSTDTKINTTFETTRKFIDDAFAEGGKVLVTCIAGRSRSATIVASYIIASYGFSARLALEMVQNARDIVDPNIEFRAQLMEFRRKLYDDLKQPETLV